MYTPITRNAKSTVPSYNFNSSFSWILVFKKNLEKFIQTQSKCASYLSWLIILPFSEKTAYIVCLQTAALRFPKIISQMPERCFFLPVKTCPAHPQFKHNFHICHFSVSAEAAIKHIIIFGSKIWGKIFYQCHCPVDHIAKSID